MIGWIQSLSRLRSINLEWSFVLAAALWAINAWACSLHDLREIRAQVDSPVELSAPEVGPTEAAGFVEAECPHLAGAHAILAILDSPAICLEDRMGIAVLSSVLSLVDYGATAPPVPPPIGV